MSLLRRLAGVLCSRRVGLFDKLNNNADFLNDVPPRFISAQNVLGKNELYQYVNDVVLKDVPIHYLEFGVFRGWSMQQWLATNRHPSSTFTGFDTFTGLPEDWTPARRAGAFDVHGQIPQLNDSRVRFVSGLFQHTLSAFVRDLLVQHQIVLHIDCDLYSGALYALATMDRSMPPGTIVIFDEFYDVLHEFAALRDYSAAFMRQWSGVAYTDDYAQVAVRLTS